MIKNIDDISAEYLTIQKAICLILEENEQDARFSKDEWKKDIGFGVSRVMEGGKKIAKAAVNFSHVEGDYKPFMAKMGGGEGKRFKATGVSSIIHPVNPMAPIIHFNIRFFQLDTGEYWFGGGMDLTPHYVDIPSAKWFHQQLQSICEVYDDSFYADFKNRADEYFYLSHRDETRGVGGIFFDMLKPNKGVSFEDLLAFSLNLGKKYGEIYVKLLKDASKLSYGEKELAWQNVRRGRYVEFNLIHDRGTKFGLLSGGNTESILVSLPPMAEWKYNYTPEENSDEEKTLKMMKKGIDWVNL